MVEDVGAPGAIASMCSALTHAIGGACHDCACTATLRCTAAALSICVMEIQPILKEQSDRPPTLMARQKEQVRTGFCGCLCACIRVGHTEWCPFPA